MKQTPVKLGPLALLLTVICICLAVLAVLSLATANADLRLARRHAETVQTRYALERQGQEFLRDFTEQELILPADGDNVIRKTFSENGTTLCIGLAQDGAGWRIVEWTVKADWDQSDTIGNLWSGD